MSWMKKGPSGAGPAAQPYAAPQPQAQNVANQQTTYPNYQGVTNNGTQQQQYWQMPAQQQTQQHQYGQQYGQGFTQEYPPNANQFYQQPTQYNQNYTGFNNPQQNYQQQNYYQNQPQQNYTQKPPTNDGWEDNWDWGWEDSTKQAQKAQNMPPVSVQQEQTFNNANVIEESFGTTDSWNWSMDDKKDGKANPATMQPSKQDYHESPTLSVNHIENYTTSEPNIPSSVSNVTTQPIEEVGTLHDREMVKERMPNLATGKRFHIDNLTPQWSIESQMSQESSDGPHTHSEGTYRSENQSRNSSSPGPNIDNPNSTYTQSGMDETYTRNNEWTQNSDEITLAESGVSTSRRESHDELTNSLQEMNLGNHETSSTNNIQGNLASFHRNINESIVQPSQSISPSNLPPPVSGVGPPTAASMPPPPPVSGTQPSLAGGTTPPIRPPSASLPPSSTPSTTQIGPPPTSTTSQPLPPPNLPQPTNSQNPFKNTGSFSHKSSNKVNASSSGTTGPSFPPQMSNTNLMSPAVVHKVSQQSRTAVGFEANLETTPDNSERPDQPHMSPFRPMPAPQPIPDNLEVAPQNDRNEYLQTAHLSSGDYGENTDFTRNMPPPGLRRMVVGQQESEYTQNLNISGDEPPPGLSRMVPGQQTEADNVYNQPADNYLDRHIDGQPTEGSGRPYRQADGQQTPDNYAQPAGPRANERRPIGLDRMVPGEPSNNEYPQYQGSNYAGGNEARVVTGLDRDYPIHIETNSNIREQNVDGSEYREQGHRNVIGSREPIEASQEYNALPDDRQREVTMEGENLQDLSLVSSVDLSYSREQRPEGADESGAGAGERPEAGESPERAAPASRRHSLSRLTSTPDDSDRDRAFKNSPRRDKERHKTSRDRDRDKEGRYSRGDRKYERDERPRGERRGDKERRDRDRHDRDESPDSRRHRRSTRSRRYETEDTDYYSDRERDRRSYREGSYGYGKPPREERSRRSERSRRYEREEDRDKYERRYRDIDPSRKQGNLRRDRDEQRRRGETYSPSASREAVATDEETRERRSDRRSRHRRADPYYDGYEYMSGGGGYLTQRHYEYYEQLRRTDPAAYMLLYKQLMAGHAPHYAHVGGYGAALDRGEERGSGHSGRSSANGKGVDTFMYRGECSLRDAASLRTDLSDRDLNTDASLNLQLEESTVRSERMTPFRYSTAHAKGSISSRDIVVVCGSYPVDGAPATVQLLSLAAATAHDPQRRELLELPGPLVKGVTHKKSVIEYCERRAAGAAAEGGRDAAGYALLWDLLALMLRQNGLVVGSDLAELVMRNVQQYPPERPAAPPAPPAELDPPPVDEAEAMNKLREYLIYGNRQEALEYAMSCGQWGVALALGGAGERRTRAAVAARYVRSVPPHDPLHTLLAMLYNMTPPALTGVSEEQWGDWRPHAAVLLANTPPRPEQEIKSLTQLGDSLASRGLLYCAQFCYVCAGVPFAEHPLAPLGGGGARGGAPPRLSLLGAEGRAESLATFATTRAIYATEIYEYARSLAGDYALPELQAYKVLVAARLCDCGEYLRALRYAESAARAVRAGAAPRPALVRAVLLLADRLKYHDPAPEGEEDSSEGSPRHQHWLDDVKSLAHSLQAESASLHSTPQHQLYAPQQQYSWGEQAPQQQYEPVQAVSQTYADLDPPPDYSPYYQPQPVAQHVAQHVAQPVAPPAPEHEEQPATQYSYDQWPKPEETPSYNEYWQNDSYGYGEPAGGAGSAGISLPGAGPAAHRDYDDDRPDRPTHEQKQDPDSSKPTKTENKSKDENGKNEKGKGGGWLGGILTKLSLRPPNQMILPDDKNPTIVWDEQNKRWRNLDGDGSESDQPPPPPPKTQDLAPLLNRSSSPPLQPTAAGAPPPAAPPVSNIFKMQKGRHIKKSYVDVLNPGGGGGGAAAVAGAALVPPPPPALAHNYFVPAPTNAQQGGVYDPSQITEEEPYHSGI